MMAIATCYGLIFQGVNDPRCMGLCDSYFLLLSVEAGETDTHKYTDLDSSGSLFNGKRATGSARRAVPT